MCLFLHLAASYRDATVPGVWIKSSRITVSFNLNTEWECQSDIVPVYKNVAAAHHCFSVSFQENLCIKQNKNLVSLDEPPSWTQWYWFSLMCYY